MSSKNMSHELKKNGLRIKIMKETKSLEIETEKRHCQRIKKKLVEQHDPSEALHFIK